MLLEGFVILSMASVLLLLVIMMLFVILARIVSAKPVQVTRVRVSLEIFVVLHQILVYVRLVCCLVWMVLVMLVVVVVAMV